MARNSTKRKKVDKDEKALKRNIAKTNKNMERLSTLFNDAMVNIDSRISGPNYINKKELKDLDDTVKNIISGEINNIESFTGEDISRFLVSLFDDNGENSIGDRGYVDSVDKLVKANNNEVLNFFQERYKNKYYLFDDLKQVADQLYQLKDAILTYRDSIVTSDDLSAEMAANKEFENVNTDDEDELLEKVYVMENETKMPGKLRNHVIPKVLNYGEYYVYTLPFSDIMAKYDKVNSTTDNNKKRVDHKNVNAMYNTVASENTTLFESAIKAAVGENKVEGDTLDILTESSEEYIHLSNKYFNSEYFSESTSASDMNTFKKNMLSDMNDIIRHIEVYNTDDCDLVLESSIDEAMAFVKSKKVSKSFDTGNKSNVKNNGFYADSLIDTDSVHISNDNAFANEKGCYIKLIEPTKIIPVKILNDVVIGYFYIHTDDIQMTVTKKGGIQTNQMTPSYMDSLVKGREDLEKEMVGKIVSQVVKKFDQQWLAKNKKFKQVITDALIFDDLYRKDIKFQFIPAEYITPFKVNLDEDGNGVSIIQDSLFPAKLYLAMLLFKYLLIMNKSADRNIYYVRNSGIEKDIAKSTQNVIRQVKAKQMNMTDLMNTQVMNSKLGANKDIFMPVGQSDIRPVDIDILSGMEVQLDTPLMEELKKQFLNATGLPSVLQEYIDQADYAKTLVMANAKFVSRVISIQAELNECITELYRKLLKYCTDIEPEKIASFKFTFSTPKDVNLVNTSDRIASVEQTTQLMMDAKYGREHEENNEEYKRVKDAVYGALVKENFPNLPWDVMEEAEKKFKAASVVREEEKRMKEQSLSSGASDQSGY